MYVYVNILHIYIYTEKTYNVSVIQSLCLWLIFSPQSCSHINDGMVSKNSLTMFELSLHRSGPDLPSSPTLIDGGRGLEDADTFLASNGFWGMVSSGLWYETYLTKKKKNWARLRDFDWTNHRKSSFARHQVVGRPSSSGCTRHQRSETVTAGAIWCSPSFGQNHRQKSDAPAWEAVSHLREERVNREMRASTLPYMRTYLKFCWVKNVQKKQVPVD